MKTTQDSKPSRPATMPYDAAHRSRKRMSRPCEEVLRRMVEEAAYFLAEQRGFSPLGKEDDWLKAEATIKATLAGCEEPANLIDPAEKNQVARRTNP